MERIPDRPKMLFPRAVYTDIILAHEFANGMNTKYGDGLSYTVEEIETNPDYTFMYNDND